MRTLDLDLLRTFACVAECGGFTRAGEQLGRTQSAVSLQIKRLEEAVGCPLIARTTRSLSLTRDGEQLLGHARKILSVHDAAWADMFQPDIAGLVRLGVPEDFATVHLPGVLAAFAEAHPKVELEVTCDLTMNLLNEFEAGAFDLILVKRDPGRSAVGQRVWRERLVWAARDRAIIVDKGNPVPLVVSPQPCVYRKRAVEALDHAGIGWRIAYTSPSLAGAQAAVKAGLGVAVLPREMVPPSLVALTAQNGLPVLREAEIALVVSGRASDAARRFGEHIVDALGAR